MLMTYRKAYAILLEIQICLGLETIRHKQWRDRLINSTLQRR